MGENPTGGPQHQRRTAGLSLRSVDKTRIGDSQGVQPLERVLVQRLKPLERCRQLFSLPMNVVKPVNQVFKIISIVAGGLIFIRGEKGLVKGLIYGVIAVLLTYLLFGLISLSLSIHLSAFLSPF